MVITLKNRPTVSSKSTNPVRQPLRPRFQGGAPGVGKDVLVSEIKGLDRAKKLYNVFGRIQSDPKIWNFSINDWASRLNTALAVYAPALYFSLVPKKKHFWETNGRNVLIWFATLGVTVLTKHPTIGVNPVLNHLMPQKRNLKIADAKGFGDKLGRTWQKGLDLFRPKYDYYEMLHKAGVLTEKQMKDARNKMDNKWSSLDNNQIEQLKMKMEQIPEQLKKKPSLEGLTREQAEAFMKDAPKLMNRLSTMKIAAVGVNAAATIYLIGILAMDFVFKYIAPHDSDFDASKYAKFKKKSDHNQAASANTTVPSPKPTGTFNGNPQAPVSFSPNPPLGQLPGVFSGAILPGQPMGMTRPFSLPNFPNMANPAVQGGNN